MSQLNKYRTAHPKVHIGHAPQPDVSWPRRRHRLEPRLCACAVLLIIALIASMMAPFL